MLERIKTDLAKMRDQGQTTVQIEVLEHYLTSLQKDAEKSLEMQKQQHMGTLAQYNAQANLNIEVFKSVNSAGKEALTATLFINGGAAVASLGFLGSMLSKGGSEALGLKLTIPLIAFGFGVLAGALGFGIRYFTQHFYARQHNMTGHTFNFISILFAACSYAGFGYGVYKAYVAFVTHFSH